MKRRILAVIAICVAIAAGVWVTAAQEKKGADMMVAKGPFDVKLTALDTAHKDEKAITRYSIDKIYHGDLEGAGAGEMLASGSGKGSGTYVAMEIVSGTLAGKKGTFALAHIGTQAHGHQNLSITVVPDTGTGELTGLAGKMNIIAAEGKHSYELEYKIEKQ